MSRDRPSIHLSKGLEIGYKRPLARFETSVTLQNGTHFLLGRNGRGKTTLLRTIAGSLKPVGGKVDSTGFTQYLPEDIRFDAEMNAAWIFRSLIAKPRRETAMALAKKIELDVRKPFGRLSTGNRRKVTLIAAEFSTRPGQGNILLLDEPFSGLDAFSRQAFEEHWAATDDNVLRLVSCHPDYDSMRISSAILIDGASIRHLQGEKTWDELKNLLN
ncbi:MAG: ATP-binding cassette domain-containing protein [Verrucomicrobiota bacterium]